MPAPTIKDYDSFNKLPYAERLTYWDNNGLGFENTYHVIDDDHILDIEPYGPTERLLYNRWVINHYRFRLHNGLEEGSNAGLGSRYKSFQEHKMYYDSKMAKLGTEGKIEFIESQVRYINDFIGKNPIVGKVLGFVHDSVNADQENEIFATKEPLNVLKEIAKSYDIVHYKVFLRREKGQLTQTNKNIRNNKIYKVFEMKEANIRKLYQELISESFIAPETDEDIFIRVFSNIEVPITQSIKWIDDLGMTNRRVRRHTLVELINNLVSGQTKDQNDFIKEHFVIYEKHKDDGAGKRRIVDWCPQMLTDARRKNKPIKWRSDLIQQISRSASK